MKFLLSFLIALFLLACTDDFSPKVSSSKVALGTMTDPCDGQTYKTVKIGKQTWMAENLNFASTNSRCSKDTTDKDSASSCAKYGRYYKWATAMDCAGVYSANGKGCGAEKNCVPTYPVRGICPEGWHLPSRIDWGVLISTVGGFDSAGKALKTVAGWKGDAIGSDDYGFSALPYFSYWTSTEKGFDNAYQVGFDNDRDRASIGLNKKLSSENKIRCVQDETWPKDDISKSKAKAVENADSNFIVDSRDGQIYKTVTVGNYTWMAENMKYETENSICYDDDPVNCTTYGRLYNWKALKNVCPAGWHLPTEEDWDILVNAVGDSTTAARALKSSEGWLNYKDINGGGPDEYGFSAQPVGDWFSEGDYAWQKEGVFSIAGYGAGFWTSKEYNADSAYVIGMGYFYGDISKYEESKLNGVTVRCVKD